MSDWSWRDYLKQRRDFVEARRQRTSISGVALVFIATLLAGWACSVVLWRVLGMASMPLRYALSTAVVYAAFFPAIRVWADHQRPLQTEHRGSSSWGDLGDVPADGEGCLIALAVVALGFLAAGLVAAFGGFAVLLEVAFEVAFAGVLVRRALHPSFAVGRWWQVLLRRTWLPALLMAALLVWAAAQLQQHAPQAHTLGEALAAWHQKPVKR